MNDKPLVCGILFFMRKLNLVGQKFNYLTVINESPEKDKRGGIRWLCKCECGNETIVLGSNLTKGNSNSCGCLGRANVLKAVTHHGLSKHPLHYIWRGMIGRCNNPNNPRYEYYGGRGVKVCSEWETDFVSFYNWAINNGYKKGLQIDKDKISKELGVPPLLYSPDRCMFLTRKREL